jgi:hypothetical protein
MAFDETAPSAAPSKASVLRIQVNDPSGLNELQEALDAAGVPTVNVDDNVLLVRDPLPIDPAERDELAFFLKAWAAKRPDVVVELLS